ITVNGVGSVILSGANTYTGPTIVQAGSLIVEGSIAGSDTTVNGGILGGSGTVGEVTLTGGTINPGNGAGALDTGNLILDSGTLAFQIGGNTSETYGQLNVAGTVSLNAPVNLTLDFAAYDPVDFTDEFVLVSNNLADAIAFASGTARLWYGGAQLDQGAIFIATSGALTQAFEISYTGGDGNDVVLTAVPEPATAVTLMGGVALLAGMRRRRRN
ncbi:MAG: autotransporter-associated beta strand repeat-containing protein, partial [Chthoniobacteraceae bacterium]